MDVELNPGPLQEKSIYFQQFVRYLASSRMQVINCCLRIMLTPAMLDVVVLTTRISTIYFFIRLVHCHYHRLTGGSALEKGELETFTGFNPWFPINALVEEAIICIKVPYQITSALLHL